MKCTATKLIQISIAKRLPHSVEQKQRLQRLPPGLFLFVRSFGSRIFPHSPHARGRNGAYGQRKEGPLLPPSLYLALPLWPEAVLAGGVRIGDVLCRMDAAKNKASIGG